MTMTRNYPNEVWKKLTISEGEAISSYEISNFGRIKRYPPKAAEPVFINGKNKQGVKMLTFNLKDGRRVGKLFHRLVAANFMFKPSDEHKYVIHLNYVRTNNHVQNLKWVTHQEFIVHASKSPNRKAPPCKRGEAATRAKLTENQVRLLKLRLKRIEEGKEKIKFKLLAKQFGITYMQLHRIRKGENWGHVII